MIPHTLTHDMSSLAVSPLLDDQEPEGGQPDEGARADRSVLADVLQDQPVRACPEPPQSLLRELFQGAEPPVSDDRAEADQESLFFRLMTGSEPDAGTFASGAPADGSQDTDILTAAPALGAIRLAGPQRHETAPRQPTDKPATEQSLDGLPMIGVGMRLRLRQLGIRTLSDLASSSPEALNDALGDAARIVDVGVWIDAARSACGTGD